MIAGFGIAAIGTLLKSIWLAKAEAEVNLIRAHGELALEGRIVDGALQLGEDGVRIVDRKCDRILGIFEYALQGLGNGGNRLLTPVVNTLNRASCVLGYSLVLTVDKISMLVNISLLSSACVMTNSYVIDPLHSYRSSDFCNEHEEDIACASAKYGIVLTGSVIGMCSFYALYKVAGMFSNDAKNNKQCLEMLEELREQNIQNEEDESEDDVNSLADRIRSKTREETMALSEDRGQEEEIRPRLRNSSRHLTANDVRRKLENEKLLLVNAND